MALPGTPALLPIAKIHGAHGLHGEMKLTSLTDQPDSIFNYGPLTDATGSAHYLLHRRGKASGSQTHQFIVAIDGVHDRNSAERWRGKSLYIAASALPAAETDSWYYNDLIGMTALLEDGNVHGTVKAVHNYGAGDIIEITRLDGSDAMYAFRPDTILNIDTAKRQLLLRPPEEI